MFEKFLKESFNSHHRNAKKILQEKKKKKKKVYFSKFLFLDFDETLYDNEAQAIIESDPFNRLVECLENPEPCYICIVTARRSDTKYFVDSKIKEAIEYLLEDFKGKFEIETVLDESPESKPSAYEVGKLKADCISNIITSNTENLQDILVYFYDDQETNVEEVAKALDYLNISTDNCNIV